MTEDIVTNYDSEKLVKFPAENLSTSPSVLIALGMFVQLYFMPMILLISLPSCFRHNSQYYRYFKAVLTSLLMSFMLAWFCPLIAIYLLPFKPSNLYVLLAQYFVVLVIYCIMNVIVLSTCNSCSNRLYRCFVKSLTFVLFFYLVFYGVCVTLMAISGMR